MLHKIKTRRDSFRTTRQISNSRTSFGNVGCCGNLLAKKQVEMTIGTVKFGR
jgi:hypothetical protein